jgi:hypothetical protein
MISFVLKLYPPLYIAMRPSSCHLIIILNRLILINIIAQIKRQSRFAQVALCRPISVQKVSGL